MDVIKGKDVNLRLSETYFYENENLNNLGTMQ